MPLRDTASVFFIALIALSSDVSASSGDAWAAFEAKVSKACAVAGGFPNFRASKIVKFDDRSGLAVMLISDKSSRSSISKLCVYDQRAGRASVSDAEMWSAPPQPAVEEARPMDEVPVMVRNERGHRRYSFSNGCTIIVDATRALIKSVDGPCKSYHQDISLLYASGD